MATERAAMGVAERGSPLVAATAESGTCVAGISPCARSHGHEAMCEDSLPPSHGRSLLLDLPVEVFLSHVVPYLGDKEVVAVRKVNRSLRELVSRVRPFVLQCDAASRLCTDDTAFPSIFPREHTLVDLSNIRVLKHVSALRGFRTLDVRNTIPFTNADLDVLGSAVALRFSHSHNITDLSALRNVEVLEISFLDSLVDLSPLANGRLRYFGMSSCPLARDMRALEGVHTVCLGDFTGDFSPLARSTCVSVVAADDADVAVLGNATYLRIFGSFSDVSSLRSVKYLDLSWCMNVRDVSALGGVDTLVLDHCPVEDVSALAGVRRLSLRETPVRDVSMLGGVRELDIAFCVNITDISALSSVRVLNTVCCEGLPLELRRWDGYSRTIDAYIINRIRGFDVAAGFQPPVIGRGERRKD